MQAPRAEARWTYRNRWFAGIEQPSTEIIQASERWCPRSPCVIGPDVCALLYDVGRDADSPPYM